MKRTEYTEKKNKSISFLGAFGVVVALHAGVIASVMAFSSIKKTAGELLSEQELKKQDEEFLKQMMEKENAWPQANLKPKVVAIAPKKTESPRTVPNVKPKSPILKQVAASKPKPTKTGTGQKPMPPKPSNNWQSLAANESAPKAAREFAKTKINEIIPSSASSRQKTYILASGDNLYMVSKKLNVSFESLMKANNIRDVRDLYAGLTLKVP